MYIATSWRYRTAGVMLTMSKLRGLLSSNDFPPPSGGFFASLLTERGGTILQLRQLSYKREKRHI